MKAISVLQPHASLLALGVQRIETRTWGTDHRGDLAIHASKSFPKELKEACGADPFYSALKLCDVGDVGDLPCGAIVGMASLVECVQIDEDGLIGNWSHMLEGLETQFGGYAPGRWAWILMSPWLADPPVKCDGALFLWNWPAPAHRNWRRAPDLVNCAMPGCRSRTTVGVRARCWPQGVCPECAEEVAGREQAGLPSYGSPSGILALPPSSAEPVRRRSGKPPRESGEGWRG